MAPTTTQTPKAKHTYGERTVRALDEIHRGKRKWAIHTATIKAHIKKNVQLFQDKMGPNSNTYINKTVRVFQENGAIEAAPERCSFQLTPKGNKIFQDKRKQYSIPNIEMSEEMKVKMYSEVAKEFQGQSSRNRKRSYSASRSRSRGREGEKRRRRITTGGNPNEKQLMRKTKAELVRELLASRATAAAGASTTVDAQMVESDEEEEEDEEDIPLPTDVPSYPGFTFRCGHPQATVEIPTLGRRDSIQQSTPPSSARNPTRMPSVRASRQGSECEQNYDDNARNGLGDVPMSPVSVDQDNHRPNVLTMRREFSPEESRTAQTEFENRGLNTLTNRQVFPPEELSINNLPTQAESENPSLSPSPPPPNQLQLQERLEAEMPGYKYVGPIVPPRPKRFDSGIMVHTEGRLHSPGIDIDNVRRGRRGRRSGGLNSDLAADVGVGAGVTGYDESMDVDDGVNLNDTTMVSNGGAFDNDDDDDDDDDDSPLFDGDITNNNNNEADETLTNDDASPILSPETRRLDKGKGRANPIPAYNGFAINPNGESMDLDFEPIGSSSFIGAHHDEDIGDTSTIRSDEPEYGLPTPYSTPLRGPSQLPSVLVLPNNIESLDEISSELEISRASILALEKSNKDLVAEIETVKGELAFANETIENLSVEQDLFPDEMQALRDSYSIVIQQRNRLQAQHTLLVFRNAVIVARKDKEYEDLKIKFNQLEDAKRKVQTELDKMTVDRDRYHDRFNEASERVKSLESQESAHRDNLVKIEGLEKKVKEIELQKDKLAKENEELYATIETLQGAFKTLDETINKAEQERKAAANKVKDAMNISRNTFGSTSSSASTSTAMNVD